MHGALENGVRRSGIHNVQNSLDRFVTVGRENRCAQDFLCVGAGIIGKNLRQQFDERRTAVTELGLSTRIRLCPTAWSGSGWRRKPLIARLELMCFGMPRDWQRNCHLCPLSADSLSYCAFKRIQNLDTTGSQWPRENNKSEQPLKRGHGERSP